MRALPCIYAYMYALRTQSPIQLYKRLRRNRVCFHPGERPRRRHRLKGDEKRERMEKKKAQRCRMRRSNFPVDAVYCFLRQAENTRESLPIVAIPASVAFWHLLQRRISVRAYPLGHRVTLCRPLSDIAHFRLARTNRGKVTKCTRDRL